MRLLRCGADAVLIEVDRPGEVDALRAAVVAADLPGLLEVVPAARTVLVSAEPGSGALAALRAVLDSVDPTRPPESRPREVVVPVRYDGPDLDLVARTAGLGTDEVVALHSRAEYAVAFCGFAPGFGYLTGLPEVLHQARLESPRTSVPTGSLAIAGEYSAVYPRSTPGGWRLIGSTDLVLFDPRRDRPALLAPGDRVRFEVTR
ncbi:5-oxoprolinase subunit PxpB [Umezawaea beigongshangensis]|uniref:5-oxoprolinase subunit PxpB n=1 Tax=Umezawaea beigongshangensis TaxID=2780383 RepID=UPI0018F12DC1|nr:5-oxoprolinase subunit PxpB [Umezawaea beigongshangensis]